MAQTVGFAWRRRYLLPPTDPRFLDATLDDMLTDLVAWHVHENPDAAATEVEDDGFDVEAEIAAANAEVDGGDGTLLPDGTTLPDDFEDV